MSELAETLESLVGQTLFVATSPEVLDFTDPKAPATLVIMAPNKRMDIPLSHKPAELINIIGELKYYLSQAKILIAWNAKNLFSFILAITGKELSISASIVDLKLLEAFLGHSEPCPGSFNQAKERLSRVVGNSCWEQAKTLYKTIYTPLIREILPRIETLGLAHTDQKVVLHPYYEIEGQKNGRMNCTNAFRRSFNPHHLESEKQFLTTPDFDNKDFLYFDFKNMEVSVLQWLSKDTVLGNILNRGRDVYESIWEAITGLECSPSRRKVCKGFFLPVAFGMGAATLAKRNEVSEETAKTIISRIYKKFPVAMGWLSNKDVKDNRAIDYYGRNRLFEEEYYRTQLRNFHIQAPASIVCLHKLVKLYKIIQGIARISFHVHDGYYIIPNVGQEINVLNLCKEMLEAEDELYPGLRLRVKAYRGRNLDQLKVVK